MKAGDEIIIRLRAEKSDGKCMGCYFRVDDFGCLYLNEENESDLPCKGKDLIFKQIKETTEKSR